MLIPLSLAFSPALAGDLLDAWGSDVPSATWIFALETSGDSLARAEQAREPIARLVEALPAGDRVAVLALHTRTSAALPLRTIDDAGRAALAAEIRGLELASAKSCDLGDALAEIGATVDSAGPKQPRFVLVESAFCHSPSLGSAYADGGSGCRTIRGLDQLNEAFDAANHATLSVRLFPDATPSQPVADAGVKAFQTFFAPSDTQVESQPLDAWVDALLPRARAERMPPLARAEAATLALSVEVEKGASLDNPVATLKVGSGLHHLGLTLSDLRLTGAEADLTSLALAPEQTIQVRVPVPDPPFSFVPASDVVQVPVTLEANGELVPAAALREAGVDPARPGLSATVSIPASRDYGLSAGRSVAMLASVLLLGFASTLAVRRKVRPLQLGGTFTWRHAGGTRHSLDIAHLSEAPIVVQPDGRLGLGRRDDALFVLFVERPLWNTRATVDIRKEGVEINTRRASVGRHAVVPGATSLQFLDYWLSWE